MASFFRRKLFQRLIIISLILILTVYALTLPIGSLLYGEDFTEYWSATQLAINGENPYSFESLKYIQIYEFNGLYPAPVVMFNPPWILGIIFPFGVLPYGVGRLLWILVSTGIIILCSDISWSLFNGKTNSRWIGWIIGVFYIPTISCLHSGQISPLVLLGIVGFLYFVKNHNLILAGSMVFLITIKPVLIVLFWVALLLWVIQSRSWILFLSCVTTVLIFSIISILIDPQIFSQYITLYSTNMIYAYETSLISYALRLHFGYNKYWLQYLPTVVGVFWIGNYWYRHHNNWQWLRYIPMVLIVSFITTSYGWVFDQILFIPILIQITIWILQRIRKRWPYFLVFLVINLLLVIGFLSLAQFNIWHLMEPFVFLCFYFLIARKIYQQNDLSFGF